MFSAQCSVLSGHLLIGAKDEVGRERRLASRAGRSRSQRDNSVRIGVPGLDEDLYTVVF